MPSSNVCWGIEVGFGGIKALRLERDGSQVRVADFVAIPHKKVLSTPDVDKHEVTRVTLGAFMSQYRDALRGASIAMSIPGHSSFARFAKLPPVEPKGVANLVRFEAVQQIPFPIDQVEWDYQTFVSEQSPDVEVGIFAVTRERIDERLAAYAEVGLVPDIITLSPVAVYNAIAFDLAFTEKTPGTVILDIGTTATDLIVAESGKVWVRTFPLGGHNFTEALADTFKLVYPKAEKLKSEAETSKYKRHIFEAMKPVLSELVQDVQRSISYYQDTHPDAKITRLVGVGSTFKLIGLRKLLSQSLRLEVFRMERFKRLTIEGPRAADLEAATANLATAYGLALQGLGLHTINANLMPVSVIRHALWRRKMPWFVAAAGLGLAAGGLSFVRPALDSLSLASIASDSQVRGPIRSAIDEGTRLKSRWNEASSAAQPGFLAENMLRLTERRDLYNYLLKDVGELFASANEFAERQGKAPRGRPVAELRSLDTAYIAPGGDIKPDASPGPGDTSGSTPFGGGGWGDGRDRGGSAPPPDPATSGGAGADGSAAAGPAGAFKVTLVFDSAQDDRLAFINDAFLSWLRGAANRPGVPYSFVNIPKATDIAYQRIEIEKNRPMPTSGEQWGTGSDSTGAGAGSGRDSDRSTSPPPRRPPTGGGGMGGDDEAPPPPPRPPVGSRGPQRTPTAPATGIDALAPLPERLRPPSMEGTVHRYTVTWFVQLRPAGAPADGDSASAGADPASAGQESGS